MKFSKRHHTYVERGRFWLRGFRNVQIRRSFVTPKREIFKENTQTEIEKGSRWNNKNIDKHDQEV